MEDKDKEIRSEQENTESKAEADNKPEDDGYEKVCYICRRSESKAGPMVFMPGGIYLCHDCMQKAFDSLSQNGMDLSRLPNMPYLNLGDM